MLALLAPLLMQVGIAPTTTPISPIPPELENRYRREAALPGRVDTPSAIASCLEAARVDPAKARAFAAEWVSRTSGAQQAAGNHCLGVAEGSAGNWVAAANAFIAARDAAPEPRFRARMGALAGSALLAQGDDADAITALDGAAADAAGDAGLGGAIALDRATALVRLARLDEARGALETARGMLPGDAHAWLLSATLARRQGDLAAAQGFIETAAALDPRDPAIGLEAGVVAALGGRTDAARKSFESVLLAAPEGPWADAAKAYLAQVAP